MAMAVPVRSLRVRVLCIARSGSGRVPGHMVNIYA